MKQKITGKQREKKSVPKSAPEELFPNSKGVRPPDQSWWTGAQFAALVPGYDEAKLRRLALDTNPASGSPWIPKPRAAKFEFTPTLKGVIAHLLHLTSHPSGFPDKFATQSDFTAQTPFTREMLDFARKKGCRCVLPGGRVDFRAFMEFIAARGIEKLDIIDGDFEDKRLTRERADEQAMLNAEKRGEVLFSHDQQHAIAELSATEVLFDQFLAPFKKELLETAKRGGYYDAITAMLAKHLKKLPPEHVQKPVQTTD